MKPKQDRGKMIHVWFVVAIFLMTFIGALSEDIDFPTKTGCQDGQVRYDDRCVFLAQNSAGQLIAVDWPSAERFCKALGAKLVEPQRYQVDSFLHNLCMKKGSSGTGCWIGFVQDVQYVEKGKCPSGKIPPSPGDWVFPSDCTRSISKMWNGNIVPRNTEKNCAFVGSPDIRFDNLNEVIRDDVCERNFKNVICEVPAQEPASNPNEPLCRGHGYGVRYANDRCFKLQYAWQPIPLSRMHGENRTVVTRPTAGEIKLMLALLSHEYGERPLFIGGIYSAGSSRWKWYGTNDVVSSRDLKSMGFSLPDVQGERNDQCLILKADGKLDKQSCTENMPYVEALPSESLDCNKLMDDLECGCGEVKTVDGGRWNGCVPASMVRYSSSSQAHGVANCLSKSFVFPPGIKEKLLVKHLTCLSGDRAFGRLNLQTPRRTLEAAQALLGVPGTENQNPDLRAKVSDVANLHRFFLEGDRVSNGVSTFEEEYCSVACTCQDQTSSGGGKCSSKPLATTGWPSDLELIRRALFCETSPVRGPEGGVFAAHALACVSIAQPDNRASILTDIGSAASLSLSLSGSSNTGLLTRVINHARSEALGGDGAGFSAFGAVPWLSAHFWTENEFKDLSNKMKAFHDTVNRELNQIMIQSAFNKSAAAFSGLVGALASNAEEVAKATEGQLSGAMLEADEAGQVANSALQQLESALKVVTTEGGGGTLGRVGAAVEKLINAQKNLAKKELDVKRRMAIFNFVTSSLSLIASCVTFGASSALKAGKITAKTANRLNNAAKVASKGSDLSGRTTDTLFPNGRVAGPLETTFRDLGGLLNEDAQAALEMTPAGDVFAIADSIKVFADYNGELNAIEADARSKAAAATDGVAAIREALATLAGKAASLSLTMFSAAIWARSENIDITETGLNPELLEAVGLWNTAVDNIIKLMISDFQLCPSSNAKNPYRSTLRQLSLPAGERQLALRAVSQSPATFERSLGAKDTVDEREAAANAWDTLAFECSGFFVDLRELAKWGAETQTNVFSAVKAVRFQIMVKLNARAASMSVENFNALVPKANVEDTVALGYAKSASRALVYVGVAGLLGIARALVADLCLSLTYANPGMDLSEFFSVVNSSFSVNERCFVDVRPPSHRDPMKFLESLWSGPAGFFVQNSPMYDFNKAVALKFDDFYRAAAVVKGCAAPQTAFIDAMLSGGEGEIDVTPESFHLDNTATNSDCMLNAEVRRVSIVFRGADGKVLPRTGSTTVIRGTATPANSTSLFKYTANKEGTIVEHAYTSQRGRRFNFAYRAHDLKCPVGFEDVNLGPEKGSGVICEEIKEVKYGDILERPPVFGRWRFSLGASGWPDATEMPVSATLVFHLASECRKVGKYSRDAWSTSVLRSAGRSEVRNQTMLGLVCGGLDFPRFAALSAAAPPPSPGDNGAIIAASVCVSIIVVCAVAFAVVRKLRTTSNSAEVTMVDASRNASM